MRVKAKGIAAYLRLDAKTAGCVVEDISAGGLFIRTDRVVPVGTSIALDLVDSEAKKSVKLSGQVVGIILKESAERRGAPQGLRIKFDRQPGATQAYLQRLLTRLGAPQTEAPVFYAVTGAPPKPRVQTEALKGGGLPVVRREAPSLASHPPARTDGSVGPPVLRPADSEASATHVPPGERSALGAGGVNSTETAVESKREREAAAALDDEDFDDSVPDARTVMADIGSYRAQLESAVPNLKELEALKSRVLQLESLLSDREARIYELELRLADLESAGSADEREPPAPEDATPVPAKRRE